MNKFIFVGADDWEGIYLNDTLIDEGHSINPVSLLLELQRRKIDFKDSIIDMVEAGEWLYDEGNLPDSYEEFMEKQNDSNQ